MSNYFKNSDDYKKIFSFDYSTANRIISRESGWLEFKESFNWNSKDKYVKSMAAFANNKGGYIVFGIKDKPRDLVGLQSDNFETTDEAKITAYLNSVFSPEIVFEKFVITVQSKNIGILHTHQVKTKPVVCVKNDGELREADIYYRYNARSERIKYAGIKMLFELAKEEERKSWMEHLEKISKIGPANAAIMDVIGGDITGKGGTIVIDKKLIPKLRFINEGSFKEGGKTVLKLIGDVKPVSIIAKSGKNAGAGVQITEDPNAPVIRLEEEEVLKKKYPLDYKELIRVLTTRYTDFKTNSRFHKLRKELMKDVSLSKRRYLNPSNIKSSSQDFYSPNIVKKFDKFYIKK
ncbi:MAG: ATP-binding protein [Minisyncoccia bacterium]